MLIGFEEWMGYVIVECCRWSVFELGVLLVCDCRS